MKIVAKPSGTTFKLVYIFNKKQVYMRNLTNVRRWNGPIPSEPPSDGAPETSITDLEVGQFVLARDSSDAKVTYLARIVGITSLGMTLHCWGTRGKNPRTAAFYPVYVQSNGDTVFREKQNGVTAEPWTWDVKHEGIEDLVVVQDVHITSSSGFAAKSLHAFRAVRPRMSLHRF